MKKKDSMAKPEEAALVPGSALSQGPQPPVGEVGQSSPPRSSTNRNQATKVIQLQRWKKLFVQPFGYDAFLRALETQLAVDNSTRLLLHGEQIIGFMALSGTTLEEGTTIPKTSVQMAGMGVYFQSPEQHRQFNEEVISQIEENGSHVLLLDDDRILFQVHPHQRTMHELRRNIAQMLTKKPKLVKKMIDRLQSKDCVDVQVIDD